MRWLAVALALAPACFNPKFDNPTCGPNGECPPNSTCVAGACVVEGPDDASVDPDGDPDGAADSNGVTCQGTGVWEVCAATMPSTPVALATTSLNTTTATLCDPAADFTSSTQPDVCVITATNITITGIVTVQGARPLVLFATGAITIGSGAVLDVGSHRLTGVGPGAPSAGCNAFAVTPGASANGGGGGAGGSFMSIGGNGGVGGKDLAAAGVAAPVSQMPATLRGGCNGQTGGAALLAGGAAGPGGGAVFLVASTISVTGSINASGAGGLGGSQDAGGAGGGGSGGMIVLHATSFAGSGGGKLAANGGGGGGGAGSTMGQPGSDGSVTTLTVPAAGGNGGAGNGCSGTATGGAGFAATVPATKGTDGPASGECGGAGGGAGAGYIRANAAITGATVSPGLTIVP